MGGERTGVSDQTTDMLLEVAIFDPISVSNTGRRLNILSDARYRFERGLDADSPKWVHDYVSSLIIECCGGEVSYIDYDGSGDKWKFDAVATKLAWWLVGVKAVTVAATMVTVRACLSVSGTRGSVCAFSASGACPFSRSKATLHHVIILCGAVASPA